MTGERKGVIPMEGAVPEPGATGGVVVTVYSGRLTLCSLLPSAIDRDTLQPTTTWLDRGFSADLLQLGRRRR